MLLRDPNRRSFQYQTLATYKTGGSDQSAWITKTGDQAIPIEVKGVPRLKVNVLSNLVDFTRTPVVKVSLAYGNERKTLSLPRRARRASMFRSTPMAAATMPTRYVASG